MATNKFATMLHRNKTKKITLVLVYAMLEWIMIFLLLLNSLLSFLISKFATYFGLKPPCTFCTALNNKDLICDEHVYKISQSGYYPTREKPILELIGEEDHSKGEFLETKDSIYFINYSNGDEEIELYTNQENDNFPIEGAVDEVEEKNTNEEFEKMEIGELVSSIIVAMQDLVSVATEEARSPCTNSNVNKENGTQEPSELREKEEEENNCRSLDGELEFEFFKGMVPSSPRGGLDRSIEERDEIGPSNHNNIDQDITESKRQTSPEKLLPFEDNTMTIEELKAELKANREALNALYTELEEERNASAVAASQTMNMMTRLQQEKSDMQMEAQQYQRMMEEQSEYDQEALQLLNDLMVKKEKEKQELEKELLIYKNRLLEYDARENFDFEELGIDRVKNTSLIDESFGEFEVERLSILHELKALETKLLTLASDDEHEENFENAMIVNIEPKNLLQFYEEDDAMVDEKIDLSTSNKIKSLDFKFKMVNKKVAIEEEMGHVYERLRGLETDRDFLKHCVDSLSEGDEGIGLLKEILQHLRDLRTVEDRARSIYNIDSPLS